MMCSPTPEGIYYVIMNSINREHETEVSRVSTRLNLSVSELQNLKDKQNAEPAYGFPSGTLVLKEFKDHRVTFTNDTGSPEFVDCIRVGLIFRPFGWLEKDHPMADFSILGSDPFEDEFNQRYKILPNEAVDEDHRAKMSFREFT